MAGDSPVWDTEFQSWLIKDWSGDFVLAGISPLMFGLEIWVGDQYFKAVTVLYSAPEVDDPLLALKLLNDFAEMDREAITLGSGIRISKIPPGWAKIRPGRLEIRP